jgi:RHS repeat-associated protein
MTTRLDAGVTYTQSWDAQNRLGSVAAPAKNTAWVYDADGARVSKADGAVTTVYIGGSVEVQISGTLRLTTTYYFFGGARIAMRVGANVTFLHGDRLGSASLATDAAGTVLSQERYYVWGSASMMSGTMQTDFQWQNQRRLDETQAGKLYDFNARFFTPVTGRFISPDSIVPNPADPQSLNRYTAMANNPLKFTDPSGHDPKDDYGRSMNDDCNYAGRNCLYRENPVVTHYKQVWLRTGKIRSIRDSDWHILAYLVREKKVANFNSVNRLNPVHGPPGRVSSWDVTQYIEQYKSPLQPENRPEYHGADYVSISIGASTPVVGRVGAGAQFSVTFDRYSRVFASVGINYGASWTGPLPLSGSIVAGTIRTPNDEPATKDEAIAHLGGTSIAASGGVLVGGGTVTSGPLNVGDRSTSRSDIVGVFTPQIGFGPQLTPFYFENGKLCILTGNGDSCR